MMKKLSYKIQGLLRKPKRTIDCRRKKMFNRTKRNLSRKKNREESFPVCKHLRKPGHHDLRLVFQEKEMKV